MIVTTITRSMASLHLFPWGPRPSSALPLKLIIYNLNLLFNDEIVADDDGQTGQNYMFVSFFSAGLALHADYMANMSVLGSRMGELHHSPSLLGSTELPFSLDGKKNTV